MSMQQNNALYANIAQAPGVLSAPRLVAEAGPPLHPNQPPDLARAGIKTSHIEGNDDSGWVLVDFGDVILHIFTPEQRAFYKLEALWGRSGMPAVRFQ